MTEIPDRCTLYFVHQDQVVKLPPGAELLGGNEFCDNLFFAIDNKVLGIQGHPEFGMEIMQQIIGLREKTVGTQVHQNAVKSLNCGSPDNLLFAKWIVNFLTER